MKMATSTAALTVAFDEHFEVTKQYVLRLERIFEMPRYKVQAKKCNSLEGITKETRSRIEDPEDWTATRDVGLIMAGQIVEHYEIATYGKMQQRVVTLGYNDIAFISESSLGEEKEAMKS